MKKLISSWIWTKGNESATETMGLLKEGAGDVWTNTAEYVKLGYEKVGDTLGLPLTEKVKKTVFWK